MSPLTQCSQRLLKLSSARKVAPTIFSSQRILISNFFSFGNTHNQDGNDSENTTSKSSEAKVSDVIKKRDFIEMIAEDHKLTKAQSSRILSSIFDTIIEEVANNNQVRISGFGRFESVQVNERKGRNPSTGEPLTIPAKTRVKFSAFRSFKETVND